MTSPSRSLSEAAVPADPQPTPLDPRRRAFAEALGRAIAELVLVEIGEGAVQTGDPVDSAERRAQP